MFEVKHSRSPPKGLCQTTNPEMVSVSGTLLAPLCYMDDDTDLECCSSPLTEKSGQLSRYSLSGDCCRWVIVEMVNSPETLHRTVNVAVNPRDPWSSGEFLLS